MRIAMLTGGGDVPGLNPCIKAIVTRAGALGWETVGFRRGWAGPLRVDPGDEGSVREHVMALDSTTVRDIDRTAGPYCTPRAPTPARSRRRICRTFYGPSTDPGQANGSTARTT